jgi:uncharacterized LabA/DUF88 family protein
MNFFKGLDIIFFSDRYRNLYFYITKNNIILNTPELLCETIHQDELEVVYFYNIKSYIIKNENIQQYIVSYRKERIVIFIFEVKNNDINLFFKSSNPSLIN